MPFGVSIVTQVPQYFDWLRMHLQTARNQARWAQHPGLQDWLRRSRLEAYTGLFARMRFLPPPTTDLREAFGMKAPRGEKRRRA